MQVLSVIPWEGIGALSYQKPIFVCCAIKAVRIEFLSVLPSAAFRRFVARRGRCSNIYSDCGTNFVGAHTHLQKLSKQTSEQLNIIWHFILQQCPSRVCKLQVKLRTMFWLFIKMKHSIRLVGHFVEL